MIPTGTEIANAMRQQLVLELGISDADAKQLVVEFFRTIDQLNREPVGVEG